MNEDLYQRPDGSLTTEAPAPVLTERDYAQAILDEADGFQYSNADCDADDVWDQYKDDPDYAADGYEAFADQWGEATTRERLWSFGAGDDDLARHQTALRAVLESGDDHRAYLIAVELASWLCLVGYANPEDFPYTPDERLAKTDTELADDAGFSGDARGDSATAEIARRAAVRDAAEFGLGGVAP